MMRRSLRYVLQFAFDRRMLVLGAAAVAAGLSLWALTKVSFDSDVLHLLPQRGPAVRALNSYLGAFGTLDRLYVMFEAPPDHSIGEYDEIIDQYLNRLRQLPEIERIELGIDQPNQDWSYLLDRQLLLLGPSHVSAALARFEPGTLDAVVAQAKDRLTLPSADMKAMVRQDPLGLFLLVRDRVGSRGLPVGMDPAGRRLLSADGRNQLVIAKPIEPPFDTAFARRLNAKLDELQMEATTATASAQDQPPLGIHEGGGYRIAPEAENVIRRESIVNSVASLAGILALVFAVFRSTRPLLLITAPIVLAGLVTIAILGRFYPLSTAATGCAAMLFGLGVDGMLLLYISYLHERSHGLAPAQAVGNLAAVSVSMMIGFTTTAATFLGLIPLDFPALAELGRIMGLGILVCGLFAILLVPAAVPRAGRLPSVRALTAPRLASFVKKHRIGILTMAGVATLVLAPAAWRLRIVPTVEKLEPRTAATEIEERIASRFDLATDAVMAIAHGPALDPLLAAHERLADTLGADAAAIPHLSPNVVLPSADEQRRTVERIRQAGIDPVEFAGALNRASVRAGFVPDTFAPFLSRVPRLLDANSHLTLDGYRDHGLAEVTDRFVSHRNGEYLTVTYLHPRTAEERSRLEQIVARMGPPLVLTGLSIVNQELEQRFLPELTKGALLGTAGVVALLLVGFGRVRLALIALFPVTLAIVWSMGLLALIGAELDLFSVFALLMAVGMGVDYGVHVLHRRVADPAGGASAALTRMAPAILLAGGTTLIGFGSLVTSSYGPLRMLGLVSVVTISSCLVTALLVLPALLEERA